MVTLLAAVTRDGARRDFVTDVDEARHIINALLGPIVGIRDAHETHAPNDFWVDVDDDVISGRDDFTRFGIVDVMGDRIGRVTATTGG